MNQTIEKTTLSNLVFNEDYCRIVLPFIKPDYFDIREERVVFEEITSFVDKYKKMPTKVSLEIEIENRKDLTEVEHGQVVALIQSLNPDEVDFDWLVDTTEKFCKDKAIYNAVVEGISISNAVCGTMKYAIFTNIGGSDLWHWRCQRYNNTFLD